ncbi:hypothetical protein INS49_009248 [Diaporthe citri]|uniref:uncharacterized protein n=1 Tax=Diaporthe citri TaxID=83186 RepID=UPI001C80B9AF|nr:uncharacterized protein INS49_009248 [Diaporthe citri]KAG6361029.1 hypothetical protein INS49_009248 [Diaporthe citri]
MRLAKAQALAKQYPIPTRNGRLFNLIKHIFLYKHLVLPNNKSAFNTTSNKKTYQAPTQAFTGSSNAPGLTLEANVRMIKENMASVRKIGKDSDREFGELIAMMEEKMRLCDCGLDFE